MMYSPASDRSLWIKALYGAGRRAWPDVALDPAEFARHLEALPSATVTEERGADLYLACACARGIPAALSAFECVYLAQVAAMLAGLNRHDSEVDEVRQLLRHRLLVAGPDGAAPKIAGYTGQGPLRAWLRMSARRVALTQLSANRPTAPPSEIVAATLPPELGYLRDRYQGVVRAAIESVFAGLPARQRTALRLHFIEGVPRERIGAAFQVHRTTAARWLDEARERILSETQRLLGHQLGLRPEEAESLLGALHQDLDLSIARLLKSVSGAPGGQVP